MKVQGLQQGVERTYKGVERVFDVVTKVFTDRSVFSPYLDDNLTYIGCDRRFFSGGSLSRPGRALPRACLDDE
jgi:hypothetical protein